MKNQAHPIIVVKRRKAKGHGAAHGSWKIAYADFMTAMMAFFSGDVADLHLQPKRVDSDCGVLPDSTGDCGYGRDRISNSESPIPGGVMITPKARGK